jgi:uncharacterized integral membrane protein
MEYGEIASIGKEVEFLKSLSLTKMKKFEPAIENHLKDECFKRNYKKIIVYEIEEKIKKMKEIAKMLDLDGLLEKKIAFSLKLLEFLTKDVLHYEIILKITVIIFMLIVFYAINKDKKLFNYFKGEI